MLALYFPVGDVEAASRRLSVGGARFAQPLQRVLWGYGGEVIDPDGYRVRLCARAVDGGAARIGSEGRSWTA